METKTRYRLQHEREAHGWTQQEVADLIGTSGLNVCRWEPGISVPRPYFRAKLCKLFGKSPQELDLAVPGEADKPIYDPAIPPNLLLLDRDQEHAWLKEQLSAGGRHDVVALHGLPGAGKTALAGGVAHRPEVPEHFIGGVLMAGTGAQP